MTDEGAPTVLEAEDFLELLWGERECWVALPAKTNGYWIEYPLEWPLDDESLLSRRIDRCVFDDEDLYYSVTAYAERGRNIEDVLPTGWLWADLDEVHPSAATALGFMPTIAVESSPGKYQALWRLDRLYKPSTIAKVNQGLTYALGADPGGWDLTQVLRVPSTRNFKYKGAPPVRMMWYNESLVYKASDVWAAVKGAAPEVTRVVGQVLPKRAIPRKAQQLLATKADEVEIGRAHV